MQNEKNIAMYNNDKAANNIPILQIALAASVGLGTLKSARW